MVESKKPMSETNWNAVAFPALMLAQELGEPVCVLGPIVAVELSLLWIALPVTDCEVNGAQTGGSWTRAG